MKSSRSSGFIDSFSLEKTFKSPGFINEPILLLRPSAFSSQGEVVWWWWPPQLSGVASLPLHEAVGRNSRIHCSFLQVKLRCSSGDKSFRPPPPLFVSSVPPELPVMGHRVGEGLLLLPSGPPHPPAWHTCVVFHPCLLASALHSLLHLSCPHQTVRCGTAAVCVCCCPPGPSLP